MSYLSDAPNKARTPQSEAIPGKTQVANRAGGYVFPVDEWTRLERFLILGTDGGTYYADQRELTKSSADAIRECLKEDAARTVKTIVEISDDGRAPRNVEALFTLAIVTAEGDYKDRAIALEALPKVARTATHLFQFIGFHEQLGGGWGRAFKRAISEWYTEKPVERAAYQAVKYRDREGWTHRDVLRLAKPTPERGSKHDDLFKWIVGKAPEVEAGKAEVIMRAERIVEGYEQAKVASSPAESARLITEYGLPREAVRSDHLPEVEVQAALLEDMPINAMIRNLANMTRSGLLTPTSAATADVITDITNAERLAKGRVHPFNVMLAMKTYESGHGLRGTNTWNPIPQIVDAMDDAFYATFDHLEPTGKRFLLGIDVSGSMDYQQIRGVPGMTAREAAAAMALVITKVERSYEAVTFSGRGQTHTGYGHYGYRQQPGVEAFSLSARERLDDVVKRTAQLPMGGTDCALPMLYAMENEREVDAFIVLTDNESWEGDIHASQALAQYRKESGIDAKMVAMAFTATEYSVADPDDAGMLDVVGLDAAGPQLAVDFVR